MSYLKKISSSLYKHINNVSKSMYTRFGVKSVVDLRDLNYMSNNANIETNKTSQHLDQYHTFHLDRMKSIMSDCTKEYLILDKQLKQEQMEKYQLFYKKQNQIKQ